MYYLAFTVTTLMFLIFLSVVVVDLKNSAGSITPLEESANVKPDVTLALSEEDLVKMATGKLNAQKVRGKCLHGG